VFLSVAGAPPRRTEANVIEPPQGDGGLRYAVTSHSSQGQTADRVLTHDEYSAINEDLREGFKTKIEDRVRRYHLKYGPGDLEAAVVRMYRSHFSKNA